MSIQTYIAGLREKPESTRKQIALWSSVGITVIIFLFWLANMTGVSNTVSNAVVSTVVDAAGTPTQSLVASVGSVFSDIKDLIFTPKKITYSSVELLPV